KHEVPDVITLDVEMPRMDGITFLRRLMAQRPIPVVVCSTLVGEGTHTMMAALDAGAVDVVKKPMVGTKRFLEESRIQIQDKVIAASQARLRGRTQRPQTPAPSTATAESPITPAKSPAQPRPAGRTAGGPIDRIIAVGASTGGTDAIRALLEPLPIDAPPLLIVQHMPENFTRAFAARLDSVCRITVREAGGGERLQRGTAFIAPGNMHMRIKRSSAGLVTDVQDGPLISRHRPSVDALFHSVADVARDKATGVILTGMGRDGAEGLLAMRKAGAATIGQDENTCIVYGMSRVAREIGAIEQEAPLGKIAAMMIAGKTRARA
ncbi:MAG: chemotaxis response regulator protein-glutamate methylesterase, partial [Pseudomonadota bacterium]